MAAKISSETKTTFQAICGSFSCAPDIYTGGWSGTPRAEKVEAEADLVEHRKTHGPENDWRNSPSVSTILTTVH